MNYFLFLIPFLSTSLLNGMNNFQFKETWNDTSFPLSPTSIDSIPSMAFNNEAPQKLYVRAGFSLYEYDSSIGTKVEKQNLSIPKTSWGPITHWQDSKYLIFMLGEENSIISYDAEQNSITLIDKNPFDHNDMVTYHSLVHPQKKILLYDSYSPAIGFISGNTAPLTLYNLETKEIIDNFQIRTYPRDQVTSLVFDTHNDNRLFIAGINTGWQVNPQSGPPFSYNAPIDVFDIANPTWIQRLKGQPDIIYQLLDTGNVLYSCGGSYETPVINSWDKNTGKKLKEFGENTFCLETLADHYLLAGSREGTFTIFDTRTFQKVATAACSFPCIDKCKMITPHQMIALSDINKNNDPQDWQAGIFNYSLEDTPFTSPSKNWWQFWK
jgi:hypothetical protein